MTEFFNQINPPQNTQPQHQKPKNSMLLDKLSLPNSSMFHIEGSKIHKDPSNRDISHILESEFVSSKKGENYDDDEEEEAEVKENITEEKDERKSSVKSERKKFKKLEKKSSLGLKSQSHEEIDQGLKKETGKLSKRTEKKILNKTTTFGVNDRFLKKEREARGNVSFDKYKKTSDEGKCTTPTYFKKQYEIDKNKKISAFPIETLNIPISPLLNQDMKESKIKRKKSNSRKLKMLSMIPKASEFNSRRISLEKSREVNKVKQLNFENRYQKKEDKKSSLSGRKNEYPSQNSKIMLRKSTLDINLQDRSAPNSQKQRYSRTSNNMMNISPLLYQNKSPKFDIKSKSQVQKIKQNFSHFTSQDNYQRYFSQHQPNTKEIEKDLKIENEAIQKLFESEDISRESEESLESSVSSDFKDKKKYIMRDLERSMLLNSTIGRKTEEKVV